MSRQHTITVAGTQAIIRSNGGVDIAARQITPGVYETNFSLANIGLGLVADLSKDVKTRVVREKNADRWQGETR
jgi:hypothetical protein